MTQDVDQPPFIMLCIDKRSMVQAQCCSEWTELWYGTLQGSIPRWPNQSCECIIIFKYLLLTNNCKSDTSGSDLRYLLLWHVTYEVFPENLSFFFLTLQEGTIGKSWYVFQRNVLQKCGKLYSKNVYSFIWEENYRGNRNEPCDWAVRRLGQYSLACPGVNSREILLVLL